jgi:hypothetical protein
MNMASYAELDPEDKAALDEWANTLRAWCGEQARTANHGDALYDQYWGSIKAIIDTLDTGEEIPNAGGLTGAQPLTKADVQTALMAYLDGIKTNYNTTAHRQKYGKACGTGNLIG